ncbi:MAG TPA: hypothetical protein VJ875_11675 [Pyrinomonadaceae bacterium]|nr:hypothetical protein [Pyrinomonadaceae bacterium]
MKVSASRSLFGILVFSLLLTLGVSSTAMAQGRGRGRSNWDKKCGKFVNCHDARDGRWDGRGPDRNRDFTSRSFRRYRRNRRFEVISRRGRHHNQDFDRNRNWRHRR